MEIVGAIYHNEQDLVLALQNLREKGFHIYEVIGPEELYLDTGTDDELEDLVEGQHHTDAGTIDGISTRPETDERDAANTQTLRDGLRQLGLSDELADLYLGALHQDKLLLLVQSERGKGGQVKEILQKHNALEVHRYHPVDSIPEEPSRPDLYK